MQFFLATFSLSVFFASSVMRSHRSHLVNFTTGPNITSATENLDLQYVINNHIKLKTLPSVTSSLHIGLQQSNHYI